MLKIQKSVLIFSFILIQTILSISAGLFVFYLTSRGHIAPNSYIGDLYVGSLNKDEAAKKVEEHYGNIIKSNSLNIKFDGDNQFTIKYSDIGAVLDNNSTALLAYGEKGSEVFYNLFSGYFTSERRELFPVIKYNESKLRKKLIEFSEVIDKDPESAYIFLKDREVIKKQEMNGLKLNIDNSLEKIKKEIGRKLGNFILFKSSNNFEIETLAPQFTLNDCKDANEVIAQYSTEIKSSEEDSIRLAVSAINRILLKPADLAKGWEAGTFDFNKYLSDENGIMEENNEGYNQVVSTLYAAVLEAGIDQNKITRTPHTTTVDYIEPGLDARVFGKTINFKFQDTLESALIVFAKVEDNKVIVSIVGKKKDKVIKSTVKTEVEQKIDPTVMNVENTNLQPGEKRMISQGKEGLKVNVYRIVTENGVEKSKDLLYFDNYDSEKSIVEIGPNTKWDQETTK